MDDKIDKKNSHSLTLTEVPEPHLNTQDFLNKLLRLVLQISLLFFSLRHFFFKTRFAHTQTHTQTLCSRQTVWLFSKLESSFETLPFAYWWKSSRRWEEGRTGRKSRGKKMRRRRRKRRRPLKTCHSRVPHTACVVVPAVLSWRERECEALTHRGQLTISGAFTSLEWNTSACTLTHTHWLTLIQEFHKLKWQFFLSITFLLSMQQHQSSQGEH